MQVNFKPVSVIKTRLGIQSNGPTHKFFAETCRQRMNARYVPEKKGFLEVNSNVDNKCNIVYESPYAHYQYIGKKYVDPKTGKGAFYNENYGFWSRPKVAKIPTNEDLHYTKAGTGPYWDKKMVSVEMSEVDKEVEAYVRRGCK